MRQPGDHVGGGRVVVRVDERDERAPKQFGFRPAEQLLPGRVDGLEIPVEPGSREEFARELEHAIAFAGALRDRRCKRARLAAQRVFGSMLRRHVHVDAREPDRLTIRVQNRHALGA
jgi:hypothetical protein